MSAIFLAALALFGCEAPVQTPALPAELLPLAAGHVAIADASKSQSMLWGRIGLEPIRAAGQANQRDEQRPLGALLDEFVRYAVGVDKALQRKQLWGAIELLHRMRDILMEIYARSRGKARGMHIFQAEADGGLQARFGNSLPAFDRHDIRRALLDLLSIAEREMGLLSNEQIRFDKAHQRLVAQIRER